MPEIIFAHASGGSDPIKENKGEHFGIQEDIHIERWQVLHPAQWDRKGWESRAG